jgi:hypothetical protein
MTGLITFAQDTFNRADQSPWGLASDGVNTWSRVRGNQGFSIVSNRGKVANTSATFNIFQAGTQVESDCDVTVNLQSSSSSDTLGIVLRFVDSNNFYFADIGNHGQVFEIGKDAASVFSYFSGSVSFTWVANTSYTMRFQVIGSTLRAKIWATDSAEPDWMITAVDTTFESGTFGVGAAPVVGNPLFDHFTASNIPTLALAWASFLQANQNGWNPATDGQSWLQVVGTLTLTVASSEGVATGNTNPSVHLLGSTTSVDFEGLVRFSMHQTTDSLAIVARSDSGGANCYLARQTGGSLSICKLVGGALTSITSAAFTLVIDTFYWMRFRIVGSKLLARIWADGTTEPNIWTVTLVSDTTYTGAGRFGLRIVLATGTNTTKVDSFYVVDYVWSDAVPVSDSASFVGSYIPLDQLSALDQFVALDTVSFVDSLAASDSFYGQVGPAVPPATNVVLRTRNGNAVLRTRNGNIVVRVREP